MIFPETDRVIYAANPLTEVVCQLRFPRILAIDERIPAQFQELLGSGYPFIETRDVVQLKLAPGGEEPLSKRIHYDFYTEDRQYRVTLCSEFLAVTTEHYERWEHFEKHLINASCALTKSYSIPFFTRIGLRYVDVISRKKLALEDVRWVDLIKSSALGLLAEPDVPLNDVLELSAATVLQLGDGGKATIRTGLGQTERTGDEIVFVVDSDFFYEDTIKGSDHALAICSRFNKSAGRAFRWIIHDRLHGALGPRRPAETSG